MSSCAGMPTIAPQITVRVQAAQYQMLRHVMSGAVRSGDLYGGCVAGSRWAVIPGQRNGVYGSCDTLSVLRAHCPLLL